MINTVIRHYSWPGTFTGTDLDYLCQCTLCQDEYIAIINEHTPAEDLPYARQFCVICMSKYTNKQLEKILRMQAFI